jgi:hypothetical protein
MLGGVFSSSYAGASFNSSQSGKLSVPVSRASVIYSHFKHVSGVAAPDGVNGAPVSKLKILDTLIDRLSQMRKSNHSPAAAKRPDGESDDARLDALIEQVQGQIKQLSAATVPYKSSPAIAAGSFVNIKA